MDLLFEVYAFGRFKNVRLVNGEIITYYRQYPHVFKILVILVEPALKRLGMNYCMKTDRIATLEVLLYLLDDFRFKHKRKLLGFDF